MIQKKKPRQRQELTPAQIVQLLTAITAFITAITAFVNALPK